MGAPATGDYSVVMNETTTESVAPRTDLITRTTPPTTTDGTRWQVQLSAAPAREWLQVFQTVPREGLGAASPQRLVFDRDRSSSRAT
jgi:hypothetical protein